jgi:hypothetical protein
LVDAESINPETDYLICVVVVTALYLVEKVEQVGLDAACAAIEEN